MRLVALLLLSVALTVVVVVLGYCVPYGWRDAAWIGGAFLSSMVMVTLLWVETGWDLD